MAVTLKLKGWTVTVNGTDNHYLAAGVLKAAANKVLEAEQVDAWINEDLGITDEDMLNDIAKAAVEDAMNAFLKSVDTNGR